MSNLKIQSVIFSPSIVGSMEESAFFSSAILPVGALPCLVVQRMILLFFPSVTFHAGV
jgi:hypothetical protein